MTLTQTLTVVIIFWAIIGGLGASLLLPAMQSLIHGNSRGPPRRRPTLWSEPQQRSLQQSARSSEDSSPPICCGGSGSASSSSSLWCCRRSASSKMFRTPARKIDLVGAVLSVVGMGGVASASWSGRRAEATWASSSPSGPLACPVRCWLVRRKRSGKPTLLDHLFKHLNFRIGISQQMLQQMTLGGAMIALPLFLQMTLEYNAMQAGLSLAPLSVSMFGMAPLAGRKAGKRRPAILCLSASLSAPSELPPSSHSSRESIQAGTS